MNPEAACWRFIAAVYARPGIQQACLLLQEQAQANIVLLLFSGWLARCGIALSEDTAREAATLVTPWRDAVIGPLRTIRTTLKSSPLMERPQVAALRERIKAEELEAERVELGLLVEWAITRWPLTRFPAPDLAAPNLSLCLPCHADAEARAALEPIAAACRDIITQFDSSISTHYLP